jgi:hypothetical protein
MTERTPADRKHPGRAQRLAAALKANLKRRKAQARGRAEAGEGPPDEAPARLPAEHAPGAKDDR